ncbi:MAG: Ig-like domain-containing protein, partial [Candidatus Latescibacteria bacterium]|nr:Ig-like domain-containing protein [Candidatus Latescibacterota bacterium]
MKFKGLVVLFSVFVMVISVEAQGPDYATQIRPIFEQNCQRCHISTGIARFTGFLVTSYKDVIETAKTSRSASRFGPLIIPGNAGKSPLIWKVEGKDDQGRSLREIGFGLQEPFGGSPLSPDVIRLLRAWIDNGALEKPVAVVDEDRRDNPDRIRGVIGRLARDQVVIAGVPLPIAPDVKYLDQDGKSITVDLFKPGDRVGVVLKKTADSRVVVSRIRRLPPRAGLPPREDVIRGIIGEIDPNAGTFKIAGMTFKVTGETGLFDERDGEIEFNTFRQGQFVAVSVTVEASVDLPIASVLKRVSNTDEESEAAVPKVIRGTVERIDLSSPIRPVLIISGQRFSINPAQLPRILDEKGNRLTDLTQLAARVTPNTPVLVIVTDDGRILFIRLKGTGSPPSIFIEVVSSTPGAGATGVPTETTVSVTFSAPVKPEGFTAEGLGGIVIFPQPLRQEQGQLSRDGQTASVRVSLEREKVYRIVVGIDIEGVNGQPVKPTVILFTTGRAFPTGSVAGRLIFPPDVEEKLRASPLPISVGFVGLLDVAGALDLFAKLENGGGDPGEIIPRIFESLTAVDVTLGKEYAIKGVADGAYVAFALVFIPEEVIGSTGELSLPVAGELKAKKKQGGLFSRVRPTSSVRAKRLQEGGLVLIGVHDLNGDNIPDPIRVRGQAVTGVDIVLEPFESGPPSPERPRVVSITPADGTTRVPTRTTVSVTFDRSVIGITDEPPVVLIFPQPVTQSEPKLSPDGKTVSLDVTLRAGIPYQVAVVNVEDGIAFGVKFITLLSTFPTNSISGKVKAPADVRADFGRTFVLLLSKSPTDLDDDEEGFIGAIIGITPVRPDGSYRLERLPAFSPFNRPYVAASMTVTTPDGNEIDLFGFYDKEEDGLPDQLTVGSTTNLTGIDITLRLPPPLEPLEVMESSPEDGATGVPTETVISLTFNTPLDVGDDHIALEGRIVPQPLSGSLNFEDVEVSEDRRTISTHVELAGKTTYKILLFGGMNTDGQGLREPVIMTFTTGAELPAGLISGTLMAELPIGMSLPSGKPGVPLSPEEMERLLAGTFVGLINAGAEVGEGQRVEEYVVSGGIAAGTDYTISHVPGGKYVVFGMRELPFIEEGGQTEG